MRTLFFLIGVATWGMLVAPSIGMAQDPLSLRPVGTSERETIEARLASVENNPDLDEEQRSNAAAAYRQALAAMQQRDAQRRAAATFDELIIDGRDQIRTLEAHLENMARPQAVAPGLPSGAPAAELRPQVEQAKAELATQTALLQSLRSELDTQTRRPDLIRDEIARTNARLAALEEERAALATETSLAPVVRDARAAAVRFEQAAARALLERLDKELVAVPIRLELLGARTRAEATKLRDLETRQTALEERLVAAQRAESLAAIAEAGVTVPLEAASDPTVMALRKANLETAQIIRDLADLDETARSSRNEVAARNEQVSTAFARARRQLEVAGSNELIGRVLLRERRNLPDLSEHGSRAAERTTLIEQAALRGIELDTELQRIESPERDAAVHAATSRGPDSVVADTIRKLVDSRRELLRQASSANDQYLARLSELTFEEEGLMQVTAQFREFLAENLLWIRTRDAVGPHSVPELLTNMRDFIAPEWWAQASAGLVRAIRQPIGLLASLALIAWTLLRRPMLTALRATARHVGKPSEDSVGRTLSAFAITLLLALPVSAYLVVIGLLLRGPVGVTDAARALGESLLILSPLFFFFGASRAVCLPGGLAIGHFRWKPGAVDRLRHQIDILLATFLVPTCILVLLAERSERVGGGELLRALLLILLTGLSYFLYRLLSPRNGIAAALEARSFNAAGERRRWLRLGAALAIPAFLAAETVAGYVYSAGTLLSRLILTLWLLAGALMVHEVVYRWLLVARRRLRLQQVLARREAHRAAGRDNVIDELGVKRTDLDTAVDINALDNDTRKLVRVAILLGTVAGIYWAWSDLLPALTVLDSIGLWKTDAGATPDQVLRTVTLADFLLGLAVLGLTYVGASTLPSVLEIILRQRPRIGHGSRIAFATLTRYSIVVIGAFFALSLLGASWSKLQWLVAALGVGIGFGLQEIVANFISGLIILIERPVRVGDVVTVGEVEGIVSRIRIRATTVTNWQNQEHLVPNKEFITGRVKNWSLSDEVTRLELPVGVAYGSDVDRALEILAEIAAEHPKVLREPAPFVGFFSFGDNALGLELRCFVANIGDRLGVFTDLHRLINRRFEAAGIVIAFPQRDVHLDINRPLEIKLASLERDDPQPAAR